MENKSLKQIIDNRLEKLKKKYPKNKLFFK